MLARLKADTSSDLVCRAAHAAHRTASAGHEARGGSWPRSRTSRESAHAWNRSADPVLRGSRATSRSVSASASCSSSKARRVMDSPSAPRKAPRASMTGAARQQKSSHNSSYSVARPVRRTSRSSARSACGRVMVLSRERAQPAARVALDGVLAGEGEHDLAQGDRVRGVVDLRVEAGDPRHALDARARPPRACARLGRHRGTSACASGPGDPRRGSSGPGPPRAARRPTRSARGRRAPGGRRHRGRAWRRPPRRGWPAGCRRSTRSCRAPARPRRHARPGVCAPAAR